MDRFIFLGSFTVNDEDDAAIRHAMNPDCPDMVLNEQVKEWCNVKAKQGIQKQLDKYRKEILTITQEFSISLTPMDRHAILFYEEENTYLNDIRPATKSECEKWFHDCLDYVPDYLWDMGRDRRHSLTKSHYQLVFAFMTGPMPIDPIKKVSAKKKKKKTSSKKKVNKKAKEERKR